jgi:endonuclease YncB( thermonuclease family)
MKKILSVFLFLILLLLSGCHKDSIRLPDLSGMNREQISAKLDPLGIKYIYKIKPLSYTDESQYDRFIEYTPGLEAGEWVSRTTLLYVYTTALHLTVSRLNEVILDPDYEGKSFINDGIGTVTLSRSIDGDTAYFYDNITKGTVRVRFLGIDTPESTIQKEPWGKSASLFTADRLSKANVIVLEAEGARKDTYDRYLAWVWVDGQLLNLELLQNAYTGAKLSSQSKYFQIFSEVEAAVFKTGRRYWGEIDPSYNY